MQKIEQGDNIMVEIKGTKIKKIGTFIKDYGNYIQIFTKYGYRESIMKVDIVKIKKCK